MKVAVVTGGTKGIGKGVVRYLLENGYFVYTNYASDINAAMHCELELKKISPNFKIIKANQADRTELELFISGIKKEITSIECIICNAATTIKKNSFEVSDQEWMKVMNVNLNSHFFLIRDLYSLISNNARIIFLGSGMGIYPHCMSLAYGVSKAAIHALAKNLVKDFEGTSTTVNVVAPSFVETEWQKDKPEFIRHNIYNKTALGRFATIDEVVNAIDFCIRNPFLNGSVLELDGGYCYK